MADLSINRMMKIIRPGGSIEEIPDNYRHRWSPAEILAMEIPPDNRPLIGSEAHPHKRRSPADAKSRQPKGSHGSPQGQGS